MATESQDRFQFTCRSEDDVSEERNAFTREGQQASLIQMAAPKKPFPKVDSSPVRTAAETAGASFSTDSAGRIVAWNRAAAALFGYQASAVHGKNLHDVLQSHNTFGNRIACDCGLMEMVRRGEFIRRYVIEVKTASGQEMRVVLFAHAQPDQPSTILVYEARPDARQRHGDRRSVDRLRHFPAAVGKLTPAELKVLRLLASGKRAQDVATSLNVSLTTVRHHIQKVLQKLGVHTQVEAISMVLQAGVL